MLPVEMAVVEPLPLEINTEPPRAEVLEASAVDVADMLPVDTAPVAEMPTEPAALLAARALVVMAPVPPPMVTSPPVAVPPMLATRTLPPSAPAVLMEATFILPLVMVPDDCPESSVPEPPLPLVDP